jgi:hypothetical protein
MIVLREVPNAEIRDGLKLYIVAGGVMVKKYYEPISECEQQILLKGYVTDSAAMKISIFDVA